MFYFDFRNKKAWEHDKQIAELDKVISFEDENIKICLSNSEMQGLCLDLGCGPGTTTEIIANNMEIKKVFGVDYDQYFIDYAKQCRCSEKIEYVMADCYDLPFADDYFDCSYSRYLFQHLKRPDLALKEMIRVTKKGGVVGIHDVDYDLVIHAPKIAYSDKIKRINTRLKAYHGSNLHIGKEMEEIFCKTEMLKRIRVLKTFTNNMEYPEFINLFYNASNNDLGFLLKNKLFSEEELKSYIAGVQNFLQSPDSFFQVGNYFTYGEVTK